MKINTTIRWGSLLGSQMADIGLEEPLSSLGRGREAMSVKQLNPAHYPASRAANVALHYLNTQHGSPYRWLQVEREVAKIGMKYNVQFAVKDVTNSYGFIATEMRPFWHLGAVASSFVMLKESNESTLYNMAQVANVTQLEIIHWKLIVSWCPAEGVRVLTAEWQPKCEHCVVPPANTTNTVQTPSSE
ncbi:hypothetical protein JZ751_002049 [Albula glossodonta]|uniref:Cystatin LXN-type domain-containing protein n=1 Tax=Albula glossodonta TaxID=121402 RepID=A0A8T2P6Y6_9TELE|nr:hypothetical protein JZ751_002049 [Albula glossodonta]